MLEFRCVVQAKPSGAPARQVHAVLLPLATTPRLPFAECVSHASRRDVLDEANPYSLAKIRERDMRGLFALCIAFALWDAFTTYYGTLNILHGGFEGDVVQLTQEDVKKTAAAAGFAVVILVILVSGRQVLEGRISLLFRGVFGIALLYDVMTSYMGNQAFLIGSESVDAPQFFILLGMSLLVSGSAVAIPYFPCFGLAEKR